MRFAILIHGDERAAQAISPECSEEIVRAYESYTEDLRKAGVLLGGEALQPSTRGVRVSTNAEGRRSVVDGPFSEAKEVIGGYYLIQTKDKAEAIEWAARCPAARETGRSFVEVREVMEFS